MTARRGTTLLELVAAISLAGVVLWGAVGVLAGLESVRDVREARRDETLRRVAALERIRDDLVDGAERARRAPPDAIAFELGARSISIPLSDVRIEWAGGARRRNGSLLAGDVESFDVLVDGPTGFASPVAPACDARHLPAAVKVYVEDRSVEVPLR